MPAVPGMGLSPEWLWATARASSGERFAHCAGGRGLDHSTTSGAVRSGGGR